MRCYNSMLLSHDISVFCLLHVDEKFTSIILSKRIILVLSFNIDLTVLRAFCLINVKLWHFYWEKIIYNKCLQMKQLWYVLAQTLLFHDYFTVSILLKSQVTFRLYTALYTIQTVSKQLHINKQGKNRINDANCIKYETNPNSAVSSKKAIVSLFSSKSVQCWKVWAIQLKVRLWILTPFGVTTSPIIFWTTVYYSLTVSTIIDILAETGTFLWGLDPTIIW